MCSDRVLVRLRGTPAGYRSDITLLALDRSYERLNYVVYFESADKAALRSGEHVTWNT
jgi:hypothetical protein